MYVLSEIRPCKRQYQRQIKKKKKKRTKRFIEMNNIGLLRFTQYRTIEIAQRALPTYNLAKLRYNISLNEFQQPHHLPRSL